MKLRREPQPRFSLLPRLKEPLKWIHLLQESIAYFPLVILVSGVFSSLGAKKLDKMLGEKVSGMINGCKEIGEISIRRL